MKTAKSENFELNDDNFLNFLFSGFLGLQHPTTISRIEVRGGEEVIREKLLLDSEIQEAERGYLIGDEDSPGIIHELARLYGNAKTRNQALPAIRQLVADKDGSFIDKFNSVIFDRVKTLDSLVNTVADKLGFDLDVADSVYVSQVGQQLKSLTDYARKKKDFLGDKVREVHTKVLSKRGFDNFPLRRPVNMNLFYNQVPSKDDVDMIIQRDKVEERIAQKYATDLTSAVKDYFMFKWKPQQYVSEQNRRKKLKKEGKFHLPIRGDDFMVKYDELIFGDFLGFQICSHDGNERSVNQRVVSALKSAGLEYIQKPKRKTTDAVGYNATYLRLRDEEGVIFDVHLVETGQYYYAEFLSSSKDSEVPGRNAHFVWSTENHKKMMDDRTWGLFYKTAYNSMLKLLKQANFPSIERTIPYEYNCIIGSRDLDESKVVDFFEGKKNILYSSFGHLEHEVSDWDFDHGSQSKRAKSKKAYGAAVSRSIKTQKNLAIKDLLDLIECYNKEIQRFVRDKDIEKIFRFDFSEIHETKSVSDIASQLTAPPLKHYGYFIQEAKGSFDDPVAAFPLTMEFHRLIESQRNLYKLAEVVLLDEKKAKGSKEYFSRLRQETKDIIDTIFNVSKSYHDIILKYVGAKEQKSKNPHGALRDLSRYFDLIGTLGDEENYGRLIADAKFLALHCKMDLSADTPLFLVDNKLVAEFDKTSRTYPAFYKDYMAKSYVGAGFSEPMQWLHELLNSKITRT